MKYLIAAAASISLLLVSGPVLADSVQGKVVAYDRVAKRLVLEDKTVYSLQSDTAVTPEQLSAGDVVLIDFQSPGDDGISKVNSVSIVEDYD